MSRSIADSEKRMALMPLVFGVLSGLLYLSYVISIAFLIPIQFAFVRYGKKVGLVATACSAATVLAGYAGRVAAAGQLDFAVILAGIVPPLALLGALIFVDTALPRARVSVKILLAAAALSVAAIPLVFWATSDSAFMAWLQGVVQKTLTGTGLDEANASAVAVQSINSAKSILADACGPMILWFIAGSWWFGTSAAIKSKAREGAIAAIRASQSVDSSEGARYFAAFKGLDVTSIRVPHSLLWPALALWAFLFGTLVLRVPAAVRAVAWNLALFAASWYAAQGVGIIQFLIRRSRNPALFRLLVPVAALVAVLNSTAGAIILIALPVLGISEVWLPYRNFKGASV